MAARTPAVVLALACCIALAVAQISENNYYNSLGRFACHDVQGNERGIASDGGATCSCDVGFYSSDPMNPTYDCTFGACASPATLAFSQADPSGVIFSAFAVQNNDNVQFSFTAGVASGRRVINVRLNDMSASQITRTSGGCMDYYTVRFFNVGENWGTPTAANTVVVYIVIHLEERLPALGGHHPVREVRWKKPYEVFPYVGKAASPSSLKVVSPVVLEAAISHGHATPSEVRVTVAAMLDPPYYLAPTSNPVAKYPEYLAPYVTFSIEPKNVTCEAETCPQYFELVIDLGEFAGTIDGQYELLFDALCDGPNCFAGGAVPIVPFELNLGFLPELIAPEHEYTIDLRPDKPSATYRADESVVFSVVVNGLSDMAPQLQIDGVFVLLGESMTDIEHMVTIVPAEPYNITLPLIELEAELPAILGRPFYLRVDFSLPMVAARRRDVPVKVKRSATREIHFEGASNDDHRLCI